VIRTPDQRLRVFVSSTLEELAPERAAAREAIESLRLTPVMFELGARPHPPRSLYAEYLAQSHVFVGIYGDSYGWVAPDSEISGLEEEFRLAENMPRLLYVKRSAPARDERLGRLIADIEAEGEVSYRTYENADELRRLLADDLAVLLSERFQGEAAGASLQVRLPTPADRFVGRDRELGALEARLADRNARLVTVTGPGGVGKTRLAIEVAGRVAALRRDGAHFVALGAVSDSDLVAAAIQESLAVSPAAAASPLDALVERLRDALRRRHVRAHSRRALSWPSGRPTTRRGLRPRPKRFRACVKAETTQRSRWRRSPLGSRRRSPGIGTRGLLYSRTAASAPGGRARSGTRSSLGSHSRGR
jgi:hypothetical protein